jgi:cbb3-type cytochrome oxidase subunit 3
MRATGPEIYLASLAVAFVGVIAYATNKRQREKEAQQAEEADKAKG